jgi:hypothetical protein
MRGPTRQSEKLGWPKLQQRGDRPPAGGNKRLAEQTRKLLGKHYANKYRVTSPAEQLIGCRGKSRPIAMAPDAGSLPFRDRETSIGRNTS